MNESRKKVITEKRSGNLDKKNKEKDPKKRRKISMEVIVESQELNV